MISYIENIQEMEERRKSGDNIPANYKNHFYPCYIEIITYCPQGAQCFDVVIFSKEYNTPEKVKTKRKEQLKESIEWAKERIKYATIAMEKMQKELAVLEG